MAQNISVDFSDGSVRIDDNAMFRIVAAQFGVEVGSRGRLPKGALVRALQAKGLTIEDTEFFNAAQGEANGSNGSSEYGVQLKAARDERDEKIADARAEFEATREALQAEYGIVPSGKSPGRPKGSKNGDTASKSETVYEVTARVPMRDKTTGEVMLTQSGKVRHLPSASTVTLTTAEVRTLSQTAGERGRLSESSVVEAAAAQWLPEDLRSKFNDFLKDVTVNRVERVA
jgi:hypothetical protein